ncbi:50S ribosomal protein L32 [Candidatus Omnitrophota bacterium]
MAVPKRRQSKMRTRKRRTHDTIGVAALTTCKECGAAIKPHCICAKCGFYKGKRVVTIKVKTKKKDEK